MLHLWHIRSPQDTHSPASFGLAEVPQDHVMRAAQFLRNGSCAHAVRVQRFRSTFCSVHSPCSAFAAGGLFGASMALAEPCLILCVHLSVVLHCAARTTLQPDARRQAHFAAVDAHPRLGCVVFHRARPEYQRVPACHSSEFSPAVNPVM